MDQSSNVPPQREDRTGVLIGAVLVMIGLWLFAERLPWLDPVWAVLRRIRTFGWPLVLVLAGAALIILASRPERPRLPARGTRLYKSRDDKWVSGVLGGLGRYLGIDPVPLRIGYLAAALAFGPIQAVVAYVIASMIMPEEPYASESQAAPPARPGA